MGSLKSEQVPPNIVSSRLKAHLGELHRVRSPHVPNPPTCKKRASVALAIRIRPTYPHQAVYDQDKYGLLAEPFQQRLDNFFAQSWVQHGDPEVLFIKRSARIGDRWTGHIALPGGKREPLDLDDRETSMRETMEETGLDLDASHCLFIGNLPERVVTTTWGKEPLMVLCPFVYLLLRHDIPPLVLQPTEVNSAHWVPVRALISSSLKSFVRCDVSERLKKHNNSAARLFLRALFGQMLFGATQLIPTESLYSSSCPDLLPDNHDLISQIPALIHQIKIFLTIEPAPALGSQPPLLLWGLTLGIIADFLGSLHEDGASKFWSWPTFSWWDYRFVVWLLTYNFRARKLRELHIDLHRFKPEDVNNEVEELSGLDTGTISASGIKQQETIPRFSAVGKLLDGYYDLVIKAVITTLLIRLGSGALVIILLKRKFSLRP